MHNLSLILIPILVIICCHWTDATFIRRIVIHKQHHIGGHGLVHKYHHYGTAPEVTHIGAGSSGGTGNLQWVTKLLKYITEYKPELLPVLLDIAAKNPGLLSSVAGGLSKRDTSSQVEYNSDGVDDNGEDRTDTDDEDKPSDPTIVRRMFEYVLDNDGDDCFKKYVCGLTRAAIREDSTAREVIAADLTDDNESVSRRRECDTRFSKCLFKDYKVSDVIKHVVLANKGQPAGAHDGDGPHNHGGDGPDTQ